MPVGISASTPLSGAPGPPCPSPCGVSLRVARRAEDGLIIAYVGGLEAGDLTTPIRYTNMAGERHQDPLRLILAHMFNHQTHHRGQAHDLLSQTEVAPPPLDLIYFLHGRE